MTNMKEIGFGTWKLKNNEETVEIIKNAINIPKNTPVVSMQTSLIDGPLPWHKTLMPFIRYCIYKSDYKAYS